MAQDKIGLATFAEQRSALVDYATGITGSRDAAEDVVQEAWLRLNRPSAPGAVEPPHIEQPVIEQPLAYLYRTVRNLALDLARRSSFEKRNFAELPDERSLTGNAPSPEETLAGRQDLELVIAALDELPERTRKAVELYRFHDYRLKDIAGHFGISLGLAHKLVFDGLDHCRQRLRRGKT